MVGKSIRNKHLFHKCKVSVSFRVLISLINHQILDLGSEIFSEDLSVFFLCSSASSVLQFVVCRYLVRV
ncbi:hypothetical protein NQ317_007359 [Molorchus minor]|uniref:Uncharacterized protein n=1 Tax=Molorchus minor TaxID=1323400 RepID=A0ABQ9JBF9_9CUCU|nr:hypothetical protein NQ317_007359 [Molorchus minor]